MGLQRQLSYWQAKQHVALEVAEAKTFRWESLARVWSKTFSLHRRNSAKCSMSQEGEGAPFHRLVDLVDLDRKFVGWWKEYFYDLLNPTGHVH